MFQVKTPMIHNKTSTFILCYLLLFKDFHLNIECAASSGNSLRKTKSEPIEIPSPSCINELDFSPVPEESYAQSDYESGPELNSESEDPNSVMFFGPLDSDDDMKSDSSPINQDYTVPNYLFKSIFKDNAVDLNLDKYHLIRDKKSRNERKTTKVLPGQNFNIKPPTFPKPAPSPSEQTPTSTLESNIVIKDGQLMRKFPKYRDNLGGFPGAEAYSVPEFEYIPLSDDSEEEEEEDEHFAEINSKLVEMYNPIIDSECSKILANQDNSAYYNSSASDDSNNNLFLDVLSEDGSFDSDSEDQTA